MNALSQVRAVIGDLSDSERAVLAHELIASLDANDVVDASEAESAWQAEVTDRLARYQNGETVLLGEEEARRALGS